MRQFKDLVRCYDVSVSASPRVELYVGLAEVDVVYYPHLPDYPVWWENLPGDYNRGGGTCDELFVFDGEG